MTVLGEADALRLGSVTPDAVYAGASKVWPLSGWSPADLPDLVSWLDGGLTNLAGGPAVTVQGSPAPVVAPSVLNGLPVIRFKVNEGRLRSTWPYAVREWTLLYVARWVGPNVGRMFSVQYPPSNLLVGSHTSQPDTAYDNGTWFTLGPSWASTPTPGPWRMYEADSASGSGMGFFIDGTQVGGRSGDSDGLTGGWGLSGYENSSAESMDFEVAELVVYKRRLSTVERQQVETYLQERWFGPTEDPATTAYMAATGLSASFQPAVDGLVVGLKTKGLWSKMKAVYPFVGGTADLHKWNLIDPRDLDAAYRLTFTGGTHTQALGWRPNDAGSSWGFRADSHLVPRGLLAQDSTHMAMYSLADIGMGDRCEMGSFNWGGGSERFNLIARYNGSVYYYDMAVAGQATNTPVPASSGLFVSTRTGPYAQAGYRNGVEVGATTHASIPLPPDALTVGGLTNYAQGPSDLPFGFASIGDGLSAQNVADLYEVVQAYQTALGRAV